MGEPRTGKMVVDWDDEDRRIADANLGAILAGVGIQPVLVVEEGMVAIHWRRPLTDPEIAMLPRTRKTGP